MHQMFTDTSVLFLLDMISCMDKKCDYFVDVF